VQSSLFINPINSPSGQQTQPHSCYTLPLSHLVQWCCWVNQRHTLFVNHRVLSKGGGAHEVVDGLGGGGSSSSSSSNDSGRQKQRKQVSVSVPMTRGKTEGFVELGSRPPSLPRPIQTLSSFKPLLLSPPLCSPVSPFHPCGSVACHQTSSHPCLHSTHRIIPMSSSSSSSSSSRQACWCQLSVP